MEAQKRPPPRIMISDDNSKVTFLDPAGCVVCICKIPPGTYPVCERSGDNWLIDFLPRSSERCCGPSGPTDTDTSCASTKSTARAIKSQMAHHGGDSSRPVNNMQCPTSAPSQPRSCDCSLEQGSCHSGAVCSKSGAVCSKSGADAKSTTPIQQAQANTPTCNVQVIGRFTIRKTDVLK